MWTIGLNCFGMLDHFGQFERRCKDDAGMAGYASGAVRVRIIRKAVVMKNLTGRAKGDQKDAEDREDSSS